MLVTPDRSEESHVPEQSHLIILTRGEINQQLKAKPPTQPEDRPMQTKDRSRPKEDPSVLEQYSVDVLEAALQILKAQALSVEPD